MTVLTSCNATETNIYNLSGESISFPFPIWWQENSRNEIIKEATKIFIDIEPLFVFLQSKNCNIVNREEVRDFLNNHADIIDYLYKAPDVVKGKFGEVNLNLELSFDPEIKSDEGELFLNIETDFDVKKAREKLKEIDKEWLIPVVGENITKFNLSLDFI